ncbi:MAG: hypothetical protein JWM95_2340 [Gemmatimonadetes bacterium]|nr:hypothetical protein [Gemmatimonadota bacterium]
MLPRAHVVPRSPSLTINARQSLSCKRALDTSPVISTPQLCCKESNKMRAERATATPPMQRTLYSAGAKKYALQ